MGLSSSRSVDWLVTITLYIKQHVRSLRETLLFFLRGKKEQKTEIFTDFDEQAAAE